MCAFLWIQPIRELLEEIILDIVLKITIALAVGFIGGKLVGLLKLPNVSGYLLIGLFLGSSFLNIVSLEDIEVLEIISELALAFIAFNIGSEFVINDMKKYGKRIFWIAFAEVIGAIVLVFSVMFFIFRQDFALSIVLASMSAATAPAATLLVIRQYGAKGPLARTVLPVVALDDIMGIIAFGIAIALAKMAASGVKFSITQLLKSLGVEILGSMIVGFAIGVVLAFSLKKLKTHDDYQIASLIAIGLGMGLSKWLGLSPLLCNIVIGTTLVNLLPKTDKIFKSVNNFVPAFYILFFTLAGASLNLSILKDVGLIGTAYVFARGFGKYFGSVLGSSYVKADETIRKYLGFALLPQGGISIGLLILVRQQLPQYAEMITTIIMFSILIYETSGPVFAQYALKKAGEIEVIEE